MCMDDQRLGWLPLWLLLFGWAAGGSKRSTDARDPGHVLHRQENSKNNTFKSVKDAPILCNWPSNASCPLCPLLHRSSPDF
ncbi:hypothetical protein V8C44DRAFT_325295 [Trichoderma aethiopicum]